MMAAPDLGDTFKLVSQAGGQRLDEAPRRGGRPISRPEKEATPPSTEFSFKDLSHAVAVVGTVDALLFMANSPELRDPPRTWPEFARQMILSVRKGALAEMAYHAATVPNSFPRAGEVDFLERYCHQILKIRVSHFDDPQQAYRLALTALYYTLTEKRKYWQNASNPEMCLREWTRQRLVDLIEQEEDKATPRRPRHWTTPLDELTAVDDLLAAAIERSPEESLEASWIGEQIKRLSENQTLSLDAALLLQYRIDSWPDRETAEYLEWPKQRLNTAQHQIQRRREHLRGSLND